MNTFWETAKFSRVYLKRYWFRFVAGIVLAFLFGTSNAVFLGGAYTMMSRLNDPSQNQQEMVKTQQKEAKSLEGKKGATLMLRKAKIEAGHEVQALLDDWLPRKGRPLDWMQITGGLLFLPLLAALRGFLGYGSSYLLAWSGQKITNDVKLDAFRKISSMSLDYFQKTTTAELIVRIENDSVGLNNFLKLGLSDLIKEPVTIISLFLMMLAIDWRFTVIALIFLPLCVLPTRRLGKKLRDLARKNFGFTVGQSGVSMESFQNVRITKAYGLEEVHADTFRRIGDVSARIMMKQVQGREMLNPITQTLSALGIGAFLLYAGWTNTTYDKIFSFFGALGLFYGPFKRLNGIGFYLQQLGLSLERLMDLFKMEPTVREAPDAIPLPAFQRGIEFQNVSFSYGDGPVISNLSFKLDHGRRLGLAGESGSGKSSLLNLLFRFYDVTDGVILIDGVPIDHYRLADLRAQMALVSQDVLLFNATVAENIACGRIGCTREEIEEAARQAHASDFINALPEGFDTPLGERGTRLSGGQRQRIAIARAFVRNAPILVLDEATASLDSKSEAEVQSAIDQLTENRTVICVAHRLSTLRSMDEILVMDRGRVVERGGFDELLDRGRVFAAMAGRQSIFSQAA